MVTQSRYLVAILGRDHIEWAVWGDEGPMPSDHNPMPYFQIWRWPRPFGGREQENP